MPLVAAYTRDAIDSPAHASAHGAALARWLDAHPDHQLVGAWSDTPCSGRTPPEQRAGLGALLHQLAATPVDLLLVPTQAHLSRDLGALVALRARLRDLGVRVTTLGDTGTADPLDAHLVNLPLFHA